MEANDFIVKLKANGSENDLCDLEKTYNNYKEILLKLSTKDKGPFSLNVLCILCRNLDKVPTWREKISNKDLLILSIDCVRETRRLDNPERVKTLACTYHIHRHIVRQNVQLPPELVLKLSYMSFECDTDNLLHEYCKTYWNIIVDRISYIEKLKSGKLAIIKLLPKLTEDIQKVIQMYDTVQFCSNVLTFLIKKLHFIYSEYFKELNSVFMKIFEVIPTKNDLGNFKKLSEKETLDVYIKFNDCFYIIVENSWKNHFKETAFSTAVRTVISVLGHRSDMYHCLQTFYLNSFCCILTDKLNLTFVETVLNSLLVSCETTEKLGYGKVMCVSYSYLNQFLRSYIEYNITYSDRKTWKDHFSESIQRDCLKLMQFLMKKLRYSEQLLKCDGCKVKSGLHDALRISFTSKSLIAALINQDIDLTNILMLYYNITEEQYAILMELCNLGCCNYEKCFRKLQTDIHNTAIMLNKAQYYEYSLKLFNIYLEKEFIYFKSDLDLKNISRALYNKSICDLDFKLHENALKDAFLSLVFSSDELSTDKFMSLVMDIKAKALKNGDDEEKQEELQLVTVLEACNMSLMEKTYGNLRPFLCNLKFSAFLKHEFNMYAKLWPSIIPVAGVWRSLMDLIKKKHGNWLTAENEDDLLWTLYEVILETPTVVRTIHSDYYKDIVMELLDRFSERPANTIQLKVVHATLLFLKAEYDIAEASSKHGWKVTEPNMDPDLVSVTRTVPQEHQALKCAVQALEMWVDVIKHIKEVEPAAWLTHALQVAQVFVEQFLYMYRTVEGLQLAHICCKLAEHIDDKEVYIRNAGVILSHSDSRGNTELMDIITLVGEFGGDLVKSEKSLETAIMFICDAAIYYGKCGATGIAAKLVQLAQSKILAAQDTEGSPNLDLGIGRLMDAQTQLCKLSGPSTLSAVIGTQRHYLTVGNGGTRWVSRRHRSLAVKRLGARAGVCGVRGARALLAWRRARGAAAAALPAAAAPAAAALLAAAADAHRTRHAQIKIDNRLKHILGFQMSNDYQPKHQAFESKTAQQLFTPKQELEPMRDSQIFKKTQTSPSVPCVSVPAFKMPDFISHNRKCRCYACETPYSIILAFQTQGLEASMYYRAKEFEIARNYYDGVFKMFNLVENKLLNILSEYEGRNYSKYIVDIVRKLSEMELRSVQLEILIEASFFELAQKNYNRADENIVKIHEIMEEMTDVDRYVRNEVMNLMACSAQLRNTVKKPTEIVETDFENTEFTEILKTPDTKLEKPPKMTKTKVVVKEEDLPTITRRIIKLNLDEGSSDEKEPTKTAKTKKTQFKIPVPVTMKAVPEMMTPRPTRSKPNVLVTQPSEELVTPKPSKPKEFFTPNETSEQFFTPMTSVKTYSKKTLRQNIVKNLENEFSTPNVEKENLVEHLELPKKNKPKDKRTLKRATSPGKLEKVETGTRSRRLRQPVNFNLDK